MVDMATVSNDSPALHQTGFWDLVMDPSVSSTHFKKIHREFFEHREELSRLRGRSISRREFAKLSASVATTFGLAAMIGSATVPRTAIAQTAKGVKKGTLRIGYINTLDCELFDYILEKKGIIQSMGWDAKFLGAPGGPQVMEAFIANEIDFAYVGSNTPGLAAQKGIPSKHIVGGMMGMGGWGVSNELYDQGVKDFPTYFEYARKRKAQGKPVRLSTQVPGTLTHACAMITIKDYGLDPDKDFDIKYLGPPEVASSLVSGQVDSHEICEQYGTYPEYFKAAKVIGHCIDKGPNMMHCDGLPEQTYNQCVGLAVRPGLPKEMIQACIEAHKRAAEWMVNNKEETIKIAAQVAGTPAAVEQVAMFNRSRWHYGLNYESIDSVWNNTMIKIGLAKRRFKLDDLVDTENALELKAPFKPMAGNTHMGPNDVTSEEFRRRAWKEAMSTFKIS